jgi:hypothetical protein
MFILDVFVSVRVSIVTDEQPILSVIMKRRLRSLGLLSFRETKLLGLQK